MKPVAALVERTTDDERARRQAICDACPHRSLLVCEKCMCPIVSKVNFQRASCPLGKW